MNIEEALSLLAACILEQGREDLSLLQQEIIRRSWLGQGYDEMDIPGYSIGYIKTQLGPKLWELLSEITGEGVNKKNLKIVLATLQERRLSDPSATLGAKVEDVPSNTHEPKLAESEGGIANKRQDWGEAPDVSVFYGRTEELTTLEQWIIRDRCRLVALLGMGGIGKTALSVKLTQQIQDDFEYVIWRSLHHAPGVTDILADLIKFFCNEQETPLLDSLAGSISRLMECLQSHRCLVILDGVETILGMGLAGKYREGYQEYGRLFRQVGDSKHQSCLVLTSSEKPREIALLEGKTTPVRSYKLKGLKKDAAQNILRERGLVEEDEWGNLIELYGSNPLALRIVSAAIIEIFNGKASEFIKKNTIFIGKIQEVLAQQFERLSHLEIEVMCQLALAQHPVSIERLLEDISSPVSTSKLMEAMESLSWRSLIEKISENGEVLFVLQPIVKKYVINRFDQASS